MLSPRVSVKYSHTWRTTLAPSVQDRRAGWSRRCSCIALVIVPPRRGPPAGVAVGCVALPGAAVGAVVATALPPWGAQAAMVAVAADMPSRVARRTNSRRVMRPCSSFS